eukprot:671337_1
MGADAAWLQAFYERERAYLKSEFAFLFDKDFDAELLPFPKDTLEKFPMPPEAEKLWAGPEVKKLASGAKQIAAPPFLPPKNRQSLQQSLDSGGHLRPAYNLEKSNILAERPEGHLDNVAAPTEDDKIKRDIVYMRLMEKQLLLWHLEHLKQRKTKVLEELRSSELQAMTPNSMLPPSKTRPTPVGGYPPCSAGFIRGCARSSELSILRKISGEGSGFGGTNSGESMPSLTQNSSAR